MTKEHKYIVWDNLPRWYGLSWRGEENAIVVSVDAEVLRGLETHSQDHPWVKDFMKELELENFEGSFAKNFGFDGGLERVEKGGIVEFVATLPRVFRLLDELCEECKGSGENQIWHEGKCLRCSGSGRKSVHEWKLAFAQSASLNLLLRDLEYPDEEASSDKLQLITVSLLTQRGQNGGSLGGKYSIPLVNWLSQREGYSIDGMVMAMKQAHERMLGEDRFRGSFRASVDSAGGWLNVSCPGDACGLNPNHGSVRGDGKGYEFSSHNVDSPMQQLTLLAGLAALHDEVDRAV